MPTPMRHDPTQPGTRRPAPRRPSQTRPKPQDSSSTQTELLPNTTPRDNLGSSVPTARSITETYSHKEQDNQAGALRNRSEPTPNGDRAQPRSWKSDSLTTRNLLTSGHLPFSWHPPRQLPGSKREDPSRLLHPTAYIGCVNSRINLFSSSSRFPQIHIPRIPTDRPPVALTPPPRTLGARSVSARRISDFSFQPTWRERTKVTAPPTSFPASWPLPQALRLPATGDMRVNSVCHACTGFAGQACERLWTPFTVEFQQVHDLGTGGAGSCLACLSRNGASLARPKTPSRPKPRRTRRKPSIHPLARSMRGSPPVNLNSKVGTLGGVSRLCGSCPRPHHSPCRSRLPHGLIPPRLTISWTTFALRCLPASRAVLGNRGLASSASFPPACLPSVC